MSSVILQNLVRMLIILNETYMVIAVRMWVIMEGNVGQNLQSLYLEFDYRLFKFGKEF
jgi:hypothetical protein